jgi:hypothetical protein
MATETQSHRDTEKEKKAFLDNSFFLCNCSALFVPSGRFDFRQVIYGLHVMANDLTSRSDG